MIAAPIPSWSVNLPVNAELTAACKALITGPSESGVGAQTAIFLAAAKPKEVFLAGRNLAKIQPVIDQIKREHPEVATTFVQLDLADLSSVRKAAKEVTGKVDKLDYLVNNAGSVFRSWETSQETGC